MDLQTTQNALIIAIALAVTFFLLWMTEKATSKKKSNWSCADKEELLAKFLRTGALDKECRPEMIGKLATCLVNTVTENIDSLAAWNAQQGDGPLVMPFLGLKMDSLAKCKAVACV